MTSSADRLRKWRKANPERDAKLNREGKRRRRKRANLGPELEALQEDATEQGER